MARNDRIFYACQAVAIVPTGYTPLAANIARGLQSVGMNSNFSLDQIFEIGQLGLYENVEDVADIEVSLEKVIDGESLLFTLASNGKAKTDLVAAVKQRADVWLSVFDDGQSNATGTPRNVCWNSGCYISNVSYSYSVDGNATESMSLVGNDRYWNAQGTTQAGADASSRFATITTGEFGSDEPESGVQRRVNVDLFSSTIPDLVKGQEGDLANPDAGGDDRGNYHIQSISVSADFGQENILELGRFGPYAKFVTFPIEISTEFEVIATSGDLKSVSGINTNLYKQTIEIKDDAGTVISLGEKNLLSSISYSGGDTGGGNATVSYSYTNFNDLLVDDGSSYTAP